MDASQIRKHDRTKVFHLIIAAAVLYNLFLWFASKEDDATLAPSKNELTSHSLHE